MPIRKVQGGFRWGGRGKVYPTREGAARQARAAYANGYVGKSFVRVPNKGVEVVKPTVENAAQIRRTIMHSRNARLRGNVAATNPAARQASRNSRADYEAHLANVKAKRKQEYEIRRSAHQQAGRTGPVPAAPRTTSEQMSGFRPTGRSRPQAARTSPEGRARRQEAGRHRAIENAYRKVELYPNQKQEIAGGAALLAAGGGGALYARHKVNKADDRRRDMALAGAAGVGGGVAGVGAAQIAAQGGGFGAKKLLARRRANALKDPEYAKHHNKVWGEHLHSQGLRSLTVTNEGLPSSDAQRTKAKLTTPKTLKDWRGERALAFKNLPGSRRALKFGLPAVGAAGAYGAVRHKQNKVGKSLVEIRKDNRDNRKGAATGAGVVAAGAGLAGGGIPGLKATRISSDFMGKGPMPLKTRVANLVRARRAGAFGYRVNAHSTLKNFKLSPQGIEHYNPGQGRVPDLIRAGEHGKVAPEEKIIRHLKVGRRASHGLLAGGAGLTAYGLHNRKKVEKADDDRRNAALIGGGTAAAGGGYGAARLLESQGRKWTGHAERNFAEAQRVLPELGGYTKRTGRNKILGRTHVPSVRAEARLKPRKAKKGFLGFGAKKAKAANITEEMLAGKKRGVIQRAGRLHGTAVNQSYFGNVYGTMGGAMRKVVVPAGVAAAGTGIYRNRRREQVGKAYVPSYFQGSAPTERLRAQRQRTRTEAQHAGLNAAAAGLTGASGAALGARWLGHDAAPAVVRGAGLAAHNKGVPKEAVKDLVNRADRVHTWAHKRRGRLLAASGVAAAGALGARTAARWKKSEVEGISQDLGRASAGDRLQSGSRRINKGIASAVVGSYGVRAAKKWASLPAKTRSNIVRGTLIGTATTGAVGGTAYSVNRAERWRREKKQLSQGGGVSGPVMKSESVGFGKARTNIREFDYLPENIRQDVGEGSIGIRRNPMSALDLFASSRIMAEADARAHGERISRKRLNRRARNEAQYAGSRAMLYSPTGRGSVF